MSLHLNVRSVRFTLAALVLTVMTGCAVELTVLSDTPVAHVVLVWLKDPGNAQDRAQVIRASQRLEDVRGVVRVHVGQSLPSDRDVVDDSFDVGLYVELESLEALRAYATDPLHLEILKNHLAPVTDRYVVYDFDIDR